MQPPLKVLMVGAEMAPLTQVGGLGDVMGALPVALRRRGRVDVRVALPLYPALRRGKVKLAPEIELPVPFAGKTWTTRVFRARLPGGPELLLFGQGRWIASLYGGRFDRHGFSTQHLRFGFFCAAVVEWLSCSDWVPDVIHAHDHHAGLIPALLRERVPGPHPGTLLTIHNAEHQGSFHSEARKNAPSLVDPGEGPLPDPRTRRGRFVNFLLRGIRSADLVNTVSPTYAQSLRTEDASFGLHRDFRRLGSRLVGVVNGIDVDRWNPRTDPHLPARYDARSLARRARSRLQLQTETGIARDPDALLLVMVARLARQKGILLVLGALEALLQRPLQLVICGDGAEMLVTALDRLSAYAPDRFAYAPFSSAGESLCYAGGDAFLMPSKFEPCGLTQLKAMRYGCVPIVRATGGLRDTVVDVRSNPRHGTGFRFDTYSSAAMVTAVDDALALRGDASRWAALQRRGMARDSSWEVSARRYEALYRRVVQARRR